MTAIKVAASVLSFIVFRTVFSARAWIASALRSKVPSPSTTAAINVRAAQRVAASLPLRNAYEACQRSSLLHVTAVGMQRQQRLRHGNLLSAIILRSIASLEVWPLFIGGIVLHTENMKLGANKSDTFDTPSSIP